jgi:hypothetical protein
MEVDGVVSLCRTTGQIITSSIIDNVMWRVRLRFSSRELNRWYMAAQAPACQSKLKAFRDAVPELYTCHKAIFSFHILPSGEVDSEARAGEFILRKARAAFREIFEA